SESRDEDSGMIALAIANDIKKEEEGDRSSRRRRRRHWKGWSDESGRDLWLSPQSLLQSWPHSY
ncbi:hypothetical protein Dimus_037015, partial [Dionaea muscipula]